MSYLYGLAEMNIDERRRQITFHNDMPSKLMTSGVQTRRKDTVLVLLASHEIHDKIFTSIA